MNVKAYIQSGIVESYVLGLASEAERQEFEAACMQYPEVAEARNAFELSLERELLSDALPVPVQLKQAIREKVLVPGNLSATQQTASGEPPVRRMQGWKWMAAASLILLAGTIIWGLSVYRRNQALQASNEELKKQLNQSATQLQALRQDAALLQKPEVRMAAMTGGSESRMYATVYWDTTTKDVYLMVNNLPKPASDKQYQLWALLNGQPIDLGMIEARQERLLYRMKNVQQAEAFAITLEKKGGNPSPTMPPVVITKL